MSTGRDDERRTGEVQIAIATAEVSLCGNLRIVEGLLLKESINEIARNDKVLKLIRELLSLNKIEGTYISLRMIDFFFNKFRCEDANVSRAQSLYRSNLLDKSKRYFDVFRRAGPGRVLKGRVRIELKSAPRMSKETTIAQLCFFAFFFGNDFHELIINYRSELKAHMEVGRTANKGKKSNS